MSVYSKLYDIVLDNCINAGENFEYRKTTFLKEVGSCPTVVDVSNYLDLPNEDFMEAIYVTTKKRLPEQREYEHWSAYFNLQREEFQKMFLSSVENSVVVAVNHVTFTGNPYFEQKKGLKYKLLGLVYGLTDKANLRVLGKKMPRFIQNVIRKVFL